jgi:hypothetical protein
MPVSVLMAFDAKSYEILSRVITQSAPRLKVMDLKILHASTRLAMPTVPLQDFTAELPISLGVKPQPRPFGTHSGQSVTCTSSRSCFRCGFGRPMTSRVRQVKRASWFPVSKLTPARKSAQIISKQ